MAFYCIVHNLIFHHFPCLFSASFNQSSAYFILILHLTFHSYSFWDTDMFQFVFTKKIPHFLTRSILVLCFLCFLFFQNFFKSSMNISSAEVFFLIHVLGKKDEWRLKLYNQIWVSPYSLDDELLTPTIIDLYPFFLCVSVPLFQTKYIYTYQLELITWSWKSLNPIKHPAQNESTGSTTSNEKNKKKNIIICERLSLILVIPFGVWAGAQWRRASSHRFYWTDVIVVSPVRQPFQHVTRHNAPKCKRVIEIEIDLDPASHLHVHHIFRWGVNTLLGIENWGTFENNANRQMQNWTPLWSADANIAGVLFSVKCRIRFLHPAAVAVTKKEKKHTRI